MWYRDAVADPLGEVERIYAAVGLELIPEARRAMEAWLVANARDKRPPHKYSPDDFGLTDAQVRADFADYLERFIDPREPPS